MQIIDVCPGLLAAGTSQKSLLVWSLAENKIVHKLRGNGHVSTCLVLARPLLISGGGDACVHVWHLRSAALLYKLDTCQAWLSCLCVRGNIIIGGDVRGTVMRWDLQNYSKAGAADNVSPKVVIKMSDAIRELSLDEFSLKSVSFDSTCNIIDIW